MRITEVDKSLTQSELDQLEVFADRLFAKVGIDVEFTRHFLDRVNDERNVKQITASELTRLFKQEYKRWGKPIAQMGPDSEAVLKDLATDVNIPFALRWDSANNELDLIAKTVMRKKNFKTSNKEFEVQSVDYSLDNIQHKKVFESIQQLNEALQVAALPIAVVAWNALVALRYSQTAWYAGLAVVGSVSTMYNINIYIINDKKGQFSWLEKKMAASAILAGEIWDTIRGVEDLSNPVVEKELTTLSTELETGVETLKSQYTDAGELNAETAKIIASVDASANTMAQQIADGVDPSTIAKTYIDSLTNSTGANSSGVEAAEEINQAAGQVINQIAVVSPEVVAEIQTELETNYQNASGQRAAEIKTQLTLVADAIAKATAQNTASDAKLIALANSISQAKQNDESDAKLIALATSVSQAKAAAANDAYQNDKIDDIANKSDAAAKAAKSAAATAANNAYQNNKIDDIATKSDADAKATAQTRASDEKLIKTYDILIDKNDTVSFIPDRRAQQILNDRKITVRFVGRGGGWLTFNKDEEGEYKNKKLFDELGFTPSEELIKPGDHEVGEIIKKVVSEKTGKTFAYLLPCLRQWKFDKNKDPGYFDESYCLGGPCFAFVGQGLVQKGSMTRCGIGQTVSYCSQ